MGRRRLSYAAAIPLLHGVRSRMKLHNYPGYIMHLYFSGDARYTWKHGFRAENLPKYRISLTFRTVSTAMSIYVRLSVPHFFML